MKDFFRHLDNYLLFLTCINPFPGFINWSTLIQVLKYNWILYFTFCCMYLTGAYRYDGEHGVSLGVSEQDIDEGDDLQRFAEAHAVSEDAAKAAAAAETLHGLHHVVIQETYSTDLRRAQEEKRWRMK